MWFQFLALSQTPFVTLGKYHNFYGSQFPICILGVLKVLHLPGMLEGFIIRAVAGSDNSLVVSSMEKHSEWHSEVLVA